MKKNIVFIVLCFVLLIKSALADRITNAYKQIQKGEFNKAKDLLDKELEKGKQNAGAFHVYTYYFFSEKNPAYQLDSAYFYINKAIQVYPSANPKAASDWAKDGISLNSAKELKANIEAKDFQNTQKENTLAAFQNFIIKFSSAKEIPEAIRQRNNLAWQETQTANSLEAYTDFFNNFPEAPQAFEARKRRDVLIFERETQSGRLSDYERFVENYPDNFSIQKAIHQIFELSTLEHSIKIYDNFIKKFPNSEASQKAFDWLMIFFQKEHGLKNFKLQYPDYYNPEYLNQLLEVADLQYLPIYENESYGFMDENGKLRLQPKYEEIPAQYLCKSINENAIIILENNRYGLIDKLGNKLANAEFGMISPFGAGLLKVTKNSREGLLLQNGREILSPVYDAIEPLNKYFIKVKKNRRWGLCSYNGKQIIDTRFSDIEARGDDFVVFKMGERYALEGSEGLFRLAAEKEREINPQYDAIDIINEKFVKLKENNRFALMNKQSQIIIPAEYEDIKSLSERNWAAKKDKLWFLFSNEGSKIFESGFQNLVAGRHLIGAKKEAKWGVLNEKGEVYKEFDNDSLAFIGETLLLFKAKKITAEFTTDSLTKAIDLSPYKLIRGEKNERTESPVFVCIETAQRKKGLFTQKGDKILPAVYDDIYVLEDITLNVKANSKYGLADTLGKLMLPIKYDGISDMEKGYKILLTNRKFGLFHPNPKILIEPVYESALKIYRESSVNPLFTAAKKEGLGLIDSKNKILIPFKYEEIEIWKENIALVKEGNSWFFYDFEQNKTSKMDFEDISFIKKTPEEVIIKIKKENRFGAWSSIKGEMLAPDFDIIKNIGSIENPVLFAERYFRDKESYVVTYMNAEGEVIWNKIMKDADYNKIYCESP